MKKKVEKKIEELEAIEEREELFDRMILGGFLESLLKGTFK